MRADINKFSLKNSEFIKGLATFLHAEKPEEVHQITKTIEPVIVNSAASTGDINAFNYLKEIGVNFGVVDYRGRNCLHVAAISRNFEIADFVLKNANNIDIDYDKIDLAGCSPLYYAIAYDNIDIAQLLVLKGAELYCP